MPGSTRFCVTAMMAPLRHTRVMSNKDDRDTSSDKPEKIPPNRAEVVKAQEQEAAKAISKERLKRRRLRSDNMAALTRLGLPKRRSLNMVNQRQSKKKSVAKLQKEIPAANIQSGQPMIIASAAVLGGAATVEAEDVHFYAGSFMAVGGNQNLNIGFDTPVFSTGREPTAPWPGDVSVLDQGEIQLRGSQIEPGGFNAVAGNITLNIKSIG
ncbi:hypothetical protein C8J55DRAFT_608747 [Lentinula edodes]|uniref:Uncharacterized protein n=1 Tax=Lentinula lateritia TaxID=40482 RepID=A0A9W8ZVY9_9AGAR|nr:hypothetical protein C8J55DRAFT_608747 [Lentinula edodes]